MGPLLWPAMGGLSGRPNVLVIQADQFRWDCLGCAGNPDVKTPHLDALAADGVRFENTYCPLPVCTPSRYSLLSGLYVHQHAGWSNRCTLAPGIDTFPKALRRVGYRTAGVGKMHFTPTYLDVGYDRLMLAEQNGPGRYDDDYHRALMAAGLTPAIDLVDQEREFRSGAKQDYWDTFGAARSDLPEEWHSTTWIAEQAMHALGEWPAARPEEVSLGGAAPQLLHVSFVKPHHPFDPPAPWDELYDPDGLTPLPGWTDAVSASDLASHRGYFGNESLTLPALKGAMAHYCGTITQIDHHVGRMVNRLRETGHYENTLIVFTADHGEYLGFHHMLLKGGPMYEPLAKVPLILKWPLGDTNNRRGGNGGSGRDGANDADAFRGTVSEALVSTVDVAPTILSACSAELRGSVPGLDLAAVVRGEATREFTFSENRRGGAYMVRSERFKLLLERDGQRTAFFDLEADPFEFENRIDDLELAGEVTRHKEALAQWALFETPTPTYLDEEAPQIAGENVPAGEAANRGRREAMHHFFSEGVERYWGRS
jgi:arylsulfatase A-like enzyme